MKKPCLSVFLLFISLYLCGWQTMGTARLEGRVVDEEGKSIAGATVMVKSLELIREKRSGFEKTAKTNSKGVWRMTNLRSGRCNVEASAPGYISKSEKIEISQIYKNFHVNFKLKKEKQAPVQEEPEILLQPEPLNERSAKLLEDANSLFKEKKYDEALTSYLLFLEENPDAYLIHYSIGNCYVKKRQFGLAHEEYQKVIQGAISDENSEVKKIQAEALCALGTIFLEKDDKQTAQKYFLEAFELSPRDEKLAFSMGEIFFSFRKIDEAKHYFTLATEIKPDWAEPFLKLGYLYLNKGDNPNARKHFTKFLELNPSHSDAESVKKILEVLKDVPQDSSLVLSLASIKAS